MDRPVVAGCKSVGCKRLRQSSDRAARAALRDTGREAACSTHSSLHLHAVGRQLRQSSLLAIRRYDPHNAPLIAAVLCQARSWPRVAANSPDIGPAAALRALGCSLLGIIAHRLIAGNVISANQLRPGWIAVLLRYACTFSVCDACTPRLRCLHSPFAMLALPVCNACTPRL